MTLYTYLRLSLTKQGREVRDGLQTMEAELIADRALCLKLDKCHRLAGTGIDIKLNKEIR